MQLCKNNQDENNKLNVEPQVVPEVSTARGNEVFTASLQCSPVNHVVPDEYADQLINL